jgi:hypothetical protein
LGSHSSSKQNDSLTSSWNQAVADVRPFPEADADPTLLTPENLCRLLIAG